MVFEWHRSRPLHHSQSRRVLRFPKKVSSSSARLQTDFWEGDITLTRRISMRAEGLFKDSTVNLHLFKVHLWGWAGGIASRRSGLSRQRSGCQTGHMRKKCFNSYFGAKILNSFSVFLSNQIWRMLFKFFMSQWPLSVKCLSPCSFT